MLVIRLDLNTDKFIDFKFRTSADWAKITTITQNKVQIQYANLTP